MTDYWLKIIVTVCNRGQPNHAYIDMLLKDWKYRYSKKSAKKKVDNWQSPLVCQLSYLVVFCYCHFIKSNADNLLTKNDYIKK